ncbi:hypothetical protein AAFF_G00108080 [Aldrovandia affinis]|uniref:Laminin subunit gamma-2-like n=1 Tax=Aldrovandia affinis TaxID=143900 RepID=A0AAD7RU52_9TELE|nr:hypothetical protein AAFF_G00108080 [Aldrovandia affinis]
MFTTMRTSWIFVCGISVFWHFSAEATYRYDSRCQCNGRSPYCAVDAQGVHCLNCKGNSEGRQCERCKDGFYHQGAGKSCLPCGCSPTGSVFTACDSQGRCRCKSGVQGDKCDQCPNGAPLTQDGCPQSSSHSSDQLTQSQSECFCYGHTTDCNKAKGYSIHDITSTFDNGEEEWTAAEANGVTPPELHFRWSSSHGDVEVISTESIPVYLSAPAEFLGNQVLSYGQNLSFSLRLDRGTRRPSKSDVVLEGAGLRVSASLGDLRTVLLCGQKTTHTFRLDERAGSRWQPQISSLQFQKLLQNLTAIKIRGTFGANGRGYLDNVRLVSARLGPGAPAGWVGNCSCPAGYEGQFCERCAVGYTRQSPAHGPFSTCQPCSCRGGSCDPETGDCYSGDETPAVNSCSFGYYPDLAQPKVCRICPCPLGISCSVTPGSLVVTCDRCWLGVTGPLCNKCEDGFYGDPLGEHGPRRACQRCRCGGHMDPKAVGNCNRVTGECLKCMNHTAGPSCELCEDGFHHADPALPCKPCYCSAQGSLTMKCSDRGQCLCREGFEGQKCERSSCPACFDQVKSEVRAYLLKLRKMEALFAGMESGSLPVTDSQMERTLVNAERLVAAMQASAGTLSDVDMDLQTRVMDINRRLSGEDRNLRSVSDTVDSIKEQDQRYHEQLSNTRQLITDIRNKLNAAKQEIRLAEFPLGDTDGGSHTLSSLAERATAMADMHQEEAEKVEEMAQSALTEAEKALVLMRSVISGENKVTELINDLKTKYDRSSARLKVMESQATRLSSSAAQESLLASDTLKQISSLEKTLPDPLKNKPVLDALRDSVEKNLTEFQELQTDIQEDQTKVEDLLAKGKKAQQKQDQLLARANAAKADAQESLKDITTNLDGLEEVLEKLRGFEDQINTNKAAADEAIEKLPAINATIQNAIGKNSQTQRILDNVDGDYNKALETISQLGDAVAQIEALPNNLNGSATLLEEATTFADDLKNLKTQALATMGQLTTETNDADRDNEKAKEALADAAGAYHNAKNTKDEVGETMRAIEGLLSLLGQPGSTDEDRLTELETSMADIRDTVTEKLKPRLTALEEQETGQRRLIARLDSDIDRILLDIDNLEEIRSTIPKGCFNMPPVEKP